MNVNYINKGKRAKVGICNICKQSSALSWDHVPPKGGIDSQSVEQVSILQHLAGNPEEFKPNISQNGVKYRTICRRCNSKLGRLYDPYLNDFALGVGRILKSIVKIPTPVIHYKTQPIMLIKAILGHLLAAKCVLDNTSSDEIIRDFLFDDKVKLSKEIKVFYWTYPYQDIVVIRDVFMPAVRGEFNKCGHFIGILKYFPIAYLVCDLEQYEGLDELTVYRGLNLEESAEIPIRLTQVKCSTWPEMAEDGNCVAGGANLNSSVYARPRKI
jgi:hypothetical protein